MGVMKTPGVYIQEKDAFPSGVVEVATAVPAFIGYTEKAETQPGKKDLLNRPWRITSLAEFHQYFGVDPDPRFAIQDLSGPKPAPAPAKKPTPDPSSTTTTEGAEGGAEGDETKAEPAAPAKPATPAAPAAPPAAAAAAAAAADFTVNGNGYGLTQNQGHYFLYYSLRLFFQNGGGPCYIVSVGDYGADIASEDLTKGLDLLIKEQEPTLVVIPDAVLLKESECIELQKQMLTHCGQKMKNRFAILDIHKGYRDRQDESADSNKKESTGNCIDNFRDKLGINYLKYGAAYYPWLNTTIVSDNNLGVENVADESRALLKTILQNEAASSDADEARRNQLKTEIGRIDSDKNLEAEKLKEVEKRKDAAKMNQAEKLKEARELINVDTRFLDKLLKQNSVAFQTIIGEMAAKLNLLPPGAAMAGVYTMVDNETGVWKAPANVSLNSVVSPSVQISHDDQEDLNVTPQGKSINAIRSFIGEGTLVWGARTLDGNSQDWRYIQVRRTMIMLEESIRLATKPYVFEDNVSTTWVTIKSMIRNFLTGIWKQGGLAGVKPDDAFSVHVGLGETMTAEDILNGILRVTVLVALVRPAEFIEITFQQQMQKS